MIEFKRIPASKKSLAFRQPVFGIGINDAPYMVCPKIEGKRMTCPIYQKWKGMLERGYCPKYRKRFPTYKGCSVFEPWLTFSVFAEWMEAENWEGLQLDKDLRIPNNKVYGPDACMFVTSEVNNLLTDSAAARGKYPLGVNYRKDLGKYNASCRVSGKLKHIGHYFTPEEAEEAYKEFKVKRIRGIAKGENKIVKAALLVHADIIEGTHHA